MLAAEVTADGIEPRGDAAPPADEDPVPDRVELPELSDTEAPEEINDDQYQALLSHFLVD